jgi:hypothetical protein
MSSIEQRRHPRIEVNWPAVAIDESGQSIEGAIIDASQGGVGFVSREACASGKSYDIDICIPTSAGLKHHVIGRYKNVHSRSVDMEQGNYKAGMQLIDIQADDLDILIKGMFENARNTLYL